MLVIETGSKMTKSQASEVTNILFQTKGLLKKPENKLQDYFKFCPRIIAMAAALGVFFGCLIISGQKDVLSYVCVSVMALVIIAYAFMFRSLLKYRKKLLSKDDKVTITFDEEGVEYDNHNDKKMKAYYDGVSFVRGFTEVTGIFPKELTGILICFNKKELDRVEAYLRANDIGVRIIK